MRDGTPSATPVFVDPSGRRARAVRAIGSLAAVTALGFLLAVTVVMTALPQPPHAGGGSDVQAKTHTSTRADSTQGDSARPDQR